MGYYTKYTLEYEIPEQAKAKETLDFEAECREAKIVVPMAIKMAVSEQLALEAALEIVLNDQDWFECGPLMDVVLGDADSFKWYQHEKDMKELSNKFPTILFTLSGEGEDSEDLWRAYFRGGKMHKVRARIIFDEFNEEDLK